jgi:hypothetical protein
LKTAKEDVVRAKARARVRHPAWFRDYARMEADAAEINFYSTLTVPGLLQTEEYSRAIFSAYQPLLADETVEQRITARTARQEILTGWPSPIVTAVIDESVLRRQVGGQEVLKGQLKHLLNLGRLRSTTLHVLPLGCEEHGGYEGPFILLTPRGKQQVAYLEVQDVVRLITESEEVRVLAARYGNIRGQALTSGESLSLIEKMLGDI